MADRNEPVLTLDRAALRDRIAEIAPPLADIYAGACELLGSPQLPGLPYFVAHAAREIANGLPQWITGVVSTKESKGLGHIVARWNALVPKDLQTDAATGEEQLGSQILVPRELIQDTLRILRQKESRSASADAALRWFEWLGPGNRYLPKELAPFVKEWMVLRKWFEAVNHTRRSRSAGVPDSRDAVRQFERFERWLDALLRGFFASRRELDVILDDARPDRLAEILPLLVPDAQRRYFFERLAREGDPTWLIPLRDHGFFDGPPAPGWSASPYLLRMAEIRETQEVVANVVLRILSTNRLFHWSVQRDFVDIAMRLPESSAARISRKMRQWGRGPAGTVAVKLGTLAVRLARAEQTKDALALVKALLASRRPTSSELDSLPSPSVPEPRLGLSGLAEVVERALPEFITATGLSGFELVCESVDKALAKRSEAAETGCEDGSHVWRRRIEDREIDRISAPSVFVAATARSALHLADTGTRIRDLLDVLNRYRWESFQRLGQYLLSRYPADAPDAVSSALLDRRQFSLFRREYRMLVEAGFRHVSARDQ